MEMMPPTPLNPEAAPVASVVNVSSAELGAGAVPVPVVVPGPVTVPMPVPGCWSWCRWEAGWR